MSKSNVVLIGMPAAGKSTVGRLLAERLGRRFVDTDHALEAATGRPLPALIAEQGLEGFRRQEEAVVLGLSLERAVISTGGSVVYSESAMQALAAAGWVVFLDVPLAELQARVGDPTARGMVIAAGQSFEALYRERRPLYRRYADIVVPAGGTGPDAVAERVFQAVEEQTRGPRR